MSVCLFFRRKTAYEMRISDWSSDVCSSDLVPERHPLGCDAHPKYLGPRYGLSSCPILGVGGSTSPSSSMTGAEIAAMRSRWMRFHAGSRSEEHTSELQSLMRISYAVFCLKKKKKQHELQNNRKHNHSHTINQ